ncbi:MAG: hypothetical protein HETSPECPRED_010582 [Heterodermia speciosa]|uniref:Uncharacterized protein n=1 Tax=Heterodermia speciosa TaxID=116794 RepID=A0A8H3IWZ6_9LECA|nr:MAG: hypothetical protein HETSPECPRED_010582 [Heterodermia speciosa]
MSRPTISISKFVGTIGLGLLTGVSYTLSTTTVPPLLALPSAPPAHATFLQLRTLTSRHQTLLSTLSTSSLLLAYVLSPPRSKHPYLLWASLATALGFGSEIWGYVTKSMKRKDVGSDDGLEGMEEWEVEDGGVNGEALREGMEKWRGKMGVKAGIWGLAWGISIVGLWGDR